MSPLPTMTEKTENTEAEKINEETAKISEEAANAQTALFTRVNQQMRELIKSNQRQLSNMMQGSVDYLRGRLGEIGGNDERKDD